MKTTCNILFDDEILFENMKVTINISTDLLEPWSGRLFFNRENTMIANNGWIVVEAYR